MKNSFLNKDTQRIALMFDKIAERYDKTNQILSFGVDYFWRKQSIKPLNIKAGQKILDIAAGTGTSSRLLANGGAEVVACDISDEMLKIGKKKNPDINFMHGDAMNLPFQEEKFDTVAVSFGLRNMQNPHKALDEMLRVAKPGGMLMICEFSTPINNQLLRAYNFYISKILPKITKKIVSNVDAYLYLGQSINEWPDQDTLTSWIKKSGWNKVSYKNLTWGIVSIHIGHKPL